MAVNAQITSGNIWTVITNRIPTLADSNYPLTTYWQNTTSNSFYCLTNNTSGSATWLFLQNNLAIPKAWVNFTEAATPVVNASFNVGTVTRNSAGNYTISFTTPFNDVYYVPVINSANSGAAASVCSRWIVTQTTTTFRYITSVVTGGVLGAAVTATDIGIVTIAVFGDLLLE